MKNKLQEIIDKAIVSVKDGKEKIAELRAKAAFCSTHKFNEECRIAILELDAIKTHVYRHEMTIKMLTDLLKEEL